MLPVCNVGQLRPDGGRWRAAAGGGSVRSALQRCTSGACRCTAQPPAAAAREVAVLGGEDYIYSQQSGVREELFKGSVLGVDADVATSSFRANQLRSLSHLPEGLQPPPRLLDAVATHYARCVLAGAGAIPGQTPLVLAIWGPKGAGKSMGLELCLREMGVTPVCLSAGELEDEWAGEPGRRLRERYAFAVRHAQQTGGGSCLVISDMDAGVGTFQHTANTVNTQILQGSLMALCDDPTLVSTGQEWDALRQGQLRLPIYITANDLGCLYAPLVRDGRMEKLYWEPTTEEAAGMLGHLFAPDLGPEEVRALLDAFPRQPLDFFGAIKSRLADGAVRTWLAHHSPAALAAAVSSGARGGASEPPPPRLPRATLAMALDAGRELAAEQQAVLDTRLHVEYMPATDASPEARAARAARTVKRRRRAAARQSAAAEAAAAQAAADAAAAVRAREVGTSSELSSYWSMLQRETWVASSSSEAEEGEAEASSSGGGGDGSSDSIASSSGSGVNSAAMSAAAAEAAAADATGAADAGGGSGAVTPDQLAAGLAARAVTVLDVRTARDYDWGSIKGAASAPFMLARGSALAPVLEPNPGFLAAAAAAAPDAGAPLVIYGPGPPPAEGENAARVSKEVFVSLSSSLVGEDVVPAAAAALRAAGYIRVSILAGGYRGWDLVYRPDGRRRARGAFRDTSSGELEWWTASN